MMIEQGEKLLIVHRRLFEKDTPRFFVGEVQAYEAGIAKVKGYTFVKDLFGGNMKKKPVPRIKNYVYRLGDVYCVSIAGDGSIGFCKV
jgi:hypothetical protein